MARTASRSSSVSFSCPSGTSANSPLFQRWVSTPSIVQSPARGGTIQLNRRQQREQRLEDGAKSKLWQSRETRRGVGDRQPTHATSISLLRRLTLTGLRRLSLVCLPGAARGALHPRLAYLGLSAPRSERAEGLQCDSLGWSESDERRPRSTVPETSKP